MMTESADFSLKERTDSANSKQLRTLSFAPPIVQIPKAKFSVPMRKAHILIQRNSKSICRTAQK